MAFTGAVAYAVTDNFLIGLLGVAVHAVIAYKLGDLWAPLMEDYFGLKGITVPHGDSAYMAPLAAFVDEVIEKIPGVRKINFSIKGLQQKIGVWGEPVIIGFVLGTIVGFLAGYPADQALPLGVEMAAVMVLMPRIVKCIMEGLTPLSERAKDLMQKSNKKNPREFYIGMDPAILLGDSEVIAAGILFIPITLIIAILMPGNTVLPCGDLATIGFFIAIAVSVHKGNLFRTLISGTLIMIMTIWITNQTVGWTTALGEMVGAIEPGQTLSSLDQGGAPITYIFVELFHMDNIPGLIAIAVLYGGTYFFAVAHSRKRKKALAEANKAVEAKAAPAPKPAAKTKKPTKKAKK